MAGVAAIIGFLIASSFSQSLLDVVKLLLLFTSAFVLSSSSMAINDYFDREIDAVNQPRRPIPSGRVKPKKALIFSFTLLFLGIVMSILVSTEAFVIALIACTAFTTYSAYLKKKGLVGNVAVSVCVALTFIYGASAIGFSSSLILLFSAMAFLANMSREVIKGIIDVEGDRLRGVKTLAASYGFKFSAKVAFVFMASAVALSFMPIALGYVNWLYVPIILISDVGLLVSTVLVLSKPTPERAAKSKKTMLSFMGLALVAFLVGCV